MTTQKLIEGQKKKKAKKCKHNGGKGYWNILPGFLCLKCGKEVRKKAKPSTKTSPTYNHY